MNGTNGENRSEGSTFHTLTDSSDQVVQSWRATAEILRLSSWIAECCVELHGRFGQFSHLSGIEGHPFTQFQRSHLVLSAGLEARFDVSQALTSPESK